MDKDNIDNISILMFINGYVSGCAKCKHKPTLADVLRDTYIWFEKYPACVDIEYIFRLIKQSKNPAIRRILET